MATMSSSVIPPSPRAVVGRDAIRRRPETPTSLSSRKPPLVSPPGTPVKPQQQRGAGTTPRRTRASYPAPALSSPPLSALRSPRYVSEGGSEGNRRVSVSASDFRRSTSDDCVAGNPLERSPISQGGMKSGPLHASIEVDDHLRVVEVTEFHQYIYDRDWKMLEKALKKFNGRYYQRLRERVEQQREKSQLQLTKEKSSQSSETDNISSGSGHQSIGSDPSTRMSLAWRSKSVLDLLPRSRSSQRLLGENSQDKAVVSPLLKVDDEGRTPLHLAYLNECPDAVLLELQNEEPLAAKQQDDYQQLPLHVAMMHKWPFPLIEKLIKIHPDALREKDLKGRTPLGYCVELTINEQKEMFKDVDSSIEFRWGKPVNETEKAWQFEQMNLWNKVEFLLKDLVLRKKNVIPSEHGLLLEAIKVGAPSKVINLFISRTGKYLKLDDDFAGNSLMTCVGRQYSLDTLETLVENCRQGTTVIQDYTEKTLMSHYRRGCQPIAPDLPSFGKEIIEWCKANPSWTTEVDPERTHVPFLSGASVRCQEWWATLRYLLFFAAYGKDFAVKDKGIKDIHMLHAALSISTSQPSLLQLLLSIFPESRNELCPLSKALPVHLVCTRWRYDALRSDNDTSMEKILKVFLKADATQVVRRYKDRLPLHMALIVGQSWGFVKSFIHFDKASVGMRDPQSKMFPFQLAAVKLSSKSLAMVLRQRYTPIEWKNTHPSQKQIEFDLVQDQQSRRQIGTIYELLRRHPRAIAGRPLFRGPSKVKTEILNAGQISMHYFSLVYDRDDDGWRLNATHVRLRDSITNGSIARPLAAWWNQMKDIIWETTPSDMIPLSDEYLLHAALYNPDTPPTIIELLLALFPMAASKPVPGTRIYPLHVAAGTMPYYPQIFENPYSSSSLELTLNAYVHATRVRVNRQLPIHIALSRGKTWKQIEPLVRQDRQSLWVRDPLSNLTPVEHMASYCISSFNNMYRFSLMVGYETRGLDIDELTVSERACVIRGVKKRFDLDVLSTIYELLRRAPSALLAQQLVGDSYSSMSSVTIASSSVSEDTNEATEKKLQRLVQEKSVMLPKRAATLASYIECNSPSNAMRLGLPREQFGVLDEEFPSHEPSSCSLSSKTGAAHLFDDYTKPSYDDDNVSSMGTSMTSLGLMSPLAGGSFKFSSGTPGSFESTSRYRLPPPSRTGLPNVPNLDETGHRDDR